MDNPVKRVINDAAGSAKLAVAAVAFSISLILSLIAAFQPSSLLETLLELLEDFVSSASDFFSGSLSDILFGSNAGTGVSDVMEIVQRATQTISVVQLIPAVVICVGLWLIYTSAKSVKTAAPNTVGFSLIKGVVIYKIGCWLVLSAGIFVTGLIISVAVKDWSVFAVALVGALILAVPLFFYFPVLQTINTVKGSATTGIANGKVSGFVIAMNYIIAIVCFFVNFITFVASIGNSNGLKVLSSIAMAVFLIAISIALSKYKKLISAGAYTEMTPVALAENTNGEMPSPDNGNVATVPEPIQATAEPDQPQVATEAKSRKAAFAWIAPQHWKKQTKILAAGLSALLLVIVVVIVTQVNRVQMPFSSADVEAESMDYSDVMWDLMWAGFSNVEANALDDLTIGFLYSDGEVEEVSINGKTNFNEGKRVKKNAKIVVTYHSKPDTAGGDNSNEFEPRTSTAANANGSAGAYKQVYNEYSEKISDAAKQGADMNALAEIAAEGVEVMAGYYADNPLTFGEYFSWSQKLMADYMGDGINSFWNSIFPN